MNLNHQQSRVVHAAQYAKDAKIYNKPDALEKLGDESIKLSSLIVETLVKQAVEIEELKLTIEGLRGYENENCTVV